MTKAQRSRAMTGDHERHPARPPMSEDAGGRKRIVQEDGGRLLVAVHVTPRTSRETITLEGAALRVRLTAPPVEGAANDALIALLAARLHLPKRAITLVHGTTIRQKTIAIDGISAAEFWKRVGR